MTRCQCQKHDGYQCTRDSSTKKGDNPLFCWQHQNCKKSIETQKVKQLGETPIAPPLSFEHSMGLTGYPRIKKKAVKQPLTKKQIPVKQKAVKQPLIKKQMPIERKHGEGKAEKLDDIKAFMSAYRQNIHDVSTKTMQTTMKLESGSQDFSDPLMLGAEICWMVAFNILGILKLKLVEEEEDIINKEQIENQLKANHILGIYQDTLSDSGEKMGHNHDFVVVGDNGMAHIIEHLPTECNAIYTDTASNIAQLLVDIQTGKVPDRFYGDIGPHIMGVESWTRRSLSKKSVMDYISK